MKNQVKRRPEANSLKIGWLDLRQSAKKHGQRFQGVADGTSFSGHLPPDFQTSYVVQRREPLRSMYRGYEVTTNQPPGGGLMLLQMLNMLQHFDLKQMGHNSVEYIRVMAEVMKRASVDKDRFIGGPDFVGVPIEMLLSTTHAETAVDEIRRGKKSNVPRLNNGNSSKGMTHVSVADQWGGCVSMTHSLGLPSGVISPGLGFMYNGCMAQFDSRPGRAGLIASGKGAGNYKHTSFVIASAARQSTALALLHGSPRPATSR